MAPERTGMYSQHFLKYWKTFALPLTKNNLKREKFMGTLQNIGIFLVDTLFTLYIYAVVIRFLLALSRADFYNQISQFIVKITNPLLVPIRRIIPPVGKLDTATIVLALALVFSKAFLITILAGGTLSFGVLFFYTIIELIRVIIWMYIIALVLQAIMSWVGNTYGNPLSSILNSLTNPILAPIRNVVPMVGMIDLSPMVAILGLNILLIIVNGFGI